jgi:glucose-1-phosphate adenylyltransferase
LYLLSRFYLLGSVIGYDVEEDRRKGYTITESGIVVVPRKDK